MKNNLTFQLSGQNSLKISQIPREKEKNLLNTFKGGNDLRNQLGQTKPMKKGPKIDKKLSNTQKQLKRQQDDILAQEVAALDHFKVPVTRDKTKNMIQNIKLRRREKHIEMMDRFKEDLDDYKENIFTIYSEIVNDIEQVMHIKQNSMQDYLKSCDNQEYLLTREKQFVRQVEDQLQHYKQECEGKLKKSKSQLERVKQSRGNVVDETCKNLRQELIEIAFVLEPEARDIQENQKQQIQKIQTKYYEQYAEKFQKVFQSQKERNQKIQKQTQDLIGKWRTVKEEKELQSYKEDTESDDYRNPLERVNLYDKLKQIQLRNTERKKKLLHNLVLQNPDAISKANINKWNDQLKKINDIFDAQFDTVLKQLMKVEEEIKESNNNRFTYCKQRLIYIQKHNQEEIQGILKEHCQPLLQRNLSESDSSLKKSTNYVQSLDERENQVLNGVSNFLLKLGTLNDDFISQFNTLNQKYEIEKAKILDNDEELVEKLTEELAELKKQLKESLHHIKLEEVQNKCFQKVDEIEEAYRSCHEKNKELTDTRTPSINQFFKTFEFKIAEIFELYDPSRRSELEEKNQKESEEEAMKKIELQDKKKAEEEERLIEETKKKGGKPPAAKPKDPKKLAAEIEERKKTILAEMGPKTIEQLKSNTGSTWLVFRNIEQICSQFYKIKEQENEEKKQEKQEKPANEQPKQENQEQQKQEEKPKALDYVEVPLKDCRGKNIVTDEAFIKISQLVPELTELREKFFENLGKKKMRVQKEAEESDENLLQDSLITLDQRLKEHYSLKGKIQTQIFVKRSGEITNHKKKYEKYVRLIKQKMDLQTEKFNFLLEKGLQSMKEHNSEQKKLRQHIPEGKNLSQLQGLQSRTRENYNSFGLTMKQITNELDRLCNAEIDILLQKNENFIKESKLFTDGGEYSDDEINWYKQMLEEITNQMKQQQERRNQKMKELKDHTENRRKQLLETFDKEYHTAIEELSAKDGTGKKYGRPKRIAQEKTRFEMNKCEQAQLNIDKAINQLKNIYHKVSKNGYNFEELPPVYQWRNKLMAIQSCISRYGKHIQAFKTDLKINPMIRVNYSSKVCDSKLTPEEEEEDKKRIISQLSILGSLSQQKDEKIFIKYIDDIEKIISDESRLIYVGDKAKYLTGNDKIPDFLRAYIQNMKKNAEDFRLNSIRQLRESCGRFSELIRNVIEMIFTSLHKHFNANQLKNKTQISGQYKSTYKKHKNLMDSNLKKLRPNLSNPKCQEELSTLDQEQKERTAEYVKILQEMQVKFKDLHFSIGQAFLTNLLNNYDFLILLTDSLYLYEDFIKLPGDQTEDKRHLDIKRLMIMKQKGIKIDTQSERNIRRKWQGLNFQVFDIEERKFSYKAVSEEVPKQKDKKGGKKDSKDPKKVAEEPQVDSNMTKTIETFKTWRQKEVFTCRNQVYEDFKKNYLHHMEEMNNLIEIGLKENASFDVKWSQIAKQLYL